MSVKADTRGDINRMAGMQNLNTTISRMFFCHGFYFYSILNHNLLSRYKNVYMGKFMSYMQTAI